MTEIELNDSELHIQSGLWMNMGIIFCSSLQTTFLDSHLEISFSYLKEIYLFRITGVIHLLFFVVVVTWK